MADADGTARPSRGLFFPATSDDELVEIEAFIQARCATLYRFEAMYWRPVRPEFSRTYKSKGRHIIRRLGWYRRIRFRHHKADLGLLRAFKADEMRQGIERATLAEGVRRLGEPRWLRDKADDLLETLPERAELAPFIGVHARYADLAAFAVAHWGVRTEPEANGTRAAPESESVAIAADPSHRATASGVAPESEGACDKPEPPNATGVVVTSREQRTHSLAAEIVEARLGAVDPDNWQSVWPELRKRALDEKGPFTGGIREDGALAHTNHKNEVGYFTPEALRRYFTRLRLGR